MENLRKFPLHYFLKISRKYFVKNALYPLNLFILIHLYKEHIKYKEESKKRIFKTFGGGVFFNSVNWFANSTVYIDSTLEYK